MAGFVTSVQHVTVTMGSTVTSASSSTLTGTLANLIPIITYEVGGGSDSIASQQIKAVIAAGPVVTVSRAAAATGYTVSVEVMVIEMDGTNTTIQEATSTLTGATSATASLTAVVEADSFVVHTYTNSSTLDDANDRDVETWFSSTTQLTFARGAGNGNIDGKAYVIECNANEFDVQHIRDADATSGNATGTSAAFTAVVMADTFIIGTQQNTHTTDDVRSSVIKAELASTTTVTSTRNFGQVGSQVTPTIQVVQMTGGTVQRGNLTWTTTGASTTASPSAPSDTNFDSCFHCFAGQHSVEGNGSNSASNQGAFQKLSLDSAGTTLTGERYDGTGSPQANTGSADWQVVEWEEAGGGGVTVPALDEGMLVGGLQSLSGGLA